MKVLAIVQARMGSNRLPRKVMKEIDGHPMIYYTLTKLKKSRYVDQIVLATSTQTINDSLAEYARNLGFEVFRGAEENVLERYKQAADKYKGDIIIRLTGDCPLLDPIIVDNIITKYLMYDYDYIKVDVPNTFIRGFDVEVFSKASLDKVYDIVCVQNDVNRVDFKPFREHVTYYIYNHLDEFKVGSLIGEDNIDTSINLSVDTMDDFEKAKSLIKLSGYKEIKAFLRSTYKA